MKKSTLKPTYATPYFYPKSGDLLTKEQILSMDGWKFYPSKSGKTATLYIAIDHGNGRTYMECELKRRRGGLYQAR